MLLTMVNVSPAKSTVILTFSEVSVRFFSPLNELYVGLCVTRASSWSYVPCPSQGL